MPSVTSLDKIWTIYILECSDETLYTGITVDLEKRLEKHNSGEGAKYTRSRTPCIIRFSQSGFSHSDAAKIEAKIKKLTRIEKMKIIEQQTLPQDLK